MPRAILCAATATVLCIANSVSAHAQQRPIVPNNAASDFKFKPDTRMHPATSNPTIRTQGVERNTFAHTPCRGWDLSCGKPEHDKQAAKLKDEWEKSRRRTGLNGDNDINYRTAPTAQSQQFEKQIHNSRTRGYDRGPFQPCRDRYDTGCTVGDRVF